MEHKNRLIAPPGLVDALHMEQLMNQWTSSTPESTPMIPVFDIVESQHVPEGKVIIPARVPNTRFGTNRAARRRAQFKKNRNKRIR